MLTYSGSAALFIFICGAAIASWFDKDTVFYVTATTERVEFNGYAASNRRWNFEDAALEIGNWRRRCTPDIDLTGSDEKANDEAQCFSGSIELASGVSGFVERIGTGPLWARIECPSSESCEVARIFDASEKYLLTAKAPIDLWVDDLEKKAQKSKTTLMSLSGSIRSGREVGIETKGSTAILREGSVSAMVREVIGRQRFEARRDDLRAGDAFTVDGAGESAGFVVADERPALTAAYRISAPRAFIQRGGGGEPVPVEATLFQRLIKDNFFQVIGGILAGVSALAAFVQFGMSFQADQDDDD